MTDEIYRHLEQRIEELETHVSHIQIGLILLLTFGLIAILASLWVLW